MESYLETRYETIKSSVHGMADKVVEAVLAAEKSFETRDVVAAQGVVDSDVVINETERRLDKELFAFEALTAPHASDLRFIVASVRIVKDLERIGDHAVNIAEMAIRANEIDSDKKSITPLTAQIAKAATSMFTQAVAAFHNNDYDAAMAVLVLDSHVDALCIQIEKEIIAKVSGAPEAAEALLITLLAGREWERIADLATNIAEEIVFILKSWDIKHNHYENPEEFA